MDERHKPSAPPPLTPERIFNEYAPRVYNLARRMLGNDADAEDVTQDVLLQVVRKLGTFRGESDIATWLHRVTVNAAWRTAASAPAARSTRSTTRWSTSSRTATTTTPSRGPSRRTSTPSTRRRTA
jgi:RNA polymerase sigma factor (sigma-70 family)